MTNNGLSPKLIGRGIARSVAKNETLWSLLGRPLTRLAESFSYWRQYELTERHAIKALGTSTVLNGPFQGLKYPKFQSVGSALYAKLLGSYERELHPVFEGMQGLNYSDIVDIGCAEGFYAVGLARMFPMAEVYAFDIDSTARMLCQKMAAFNNVAQRVHVGAECTRDYLAGFKVRSRGLVICDCEGFEKILFDQAVAARLSCCDLIIEAHDLIDPTITPALKAAFAGTHQVTAIKSIPDEKKVELFDYPQLQGVPNDIRRDLMEEGRKGEMEWLVCASLENGPVLQPRR